MCNDGLLGKLPLFAVVKYMHCHCKFSDDVVLVVVLERCICLTVVVEMVNKTDNGNIEAVAFHCSATHHDAVVDSQTDTSIVQQSSCSLSLDGYVAGNTDSQFHQGCCSGARSVTVPLLSMRSDVAHSSLPTVMEHPPHRVNGVATSTTTLPKRHVSFSDELQFHEFRDDDDGLTEDVGLGSDVVSECTDTVMQPQQHDYIYHLTPSVQVSLVTARNAHS